MLLWHSVYGLSDISFALTSSIKLYFAPSAHRGPWSWYSLDVRGRKTNVHSHDRFPREAPHSILLMAKLAKHNAQGKITAHSYQGKVFSKRSRFLCSYFFQF